MPAAPAVHLTSATYPNSQCSYYDASILTKSDVMPQIKFYFSAGACSLAPHILLREAGVQFEAVAIERQGAGLQFPDYYRSINPKMRVPAITIDGDPITEVPAIATAIASLAPDKYLMGRTPMDTARVYEWMNYLSGTLHSRGFGALFRPQRLSDDPTSIEGIKAKGLECIKDCFDFIEERLVGVYAIGGALTAVDPFLFVFFRWGTLIGLEMKEKYPKYTALVSNLAQRDAVKATLMAENIKSML